MGFDADDLSTHARIRYAALARFARHGVAATTFKDIAAEAQVSVGLVQHYFTTKDGVRNAVNEHVARRLTATFSVDDALRSDDVAAYVGDRITALFRDEGPVLLYLARAVADGDPAVLDVFDELVASGDRQLDQLADAGLLRDDLDRRWAVIHILSVNLATALLEGAIDRHLDAPLRDPAQIQRWNHATTELFRAGIFRADPDGRRT